MGNDNMTSLWALVHNMTFALSWFPAASLFARMRFPDALKSLSGALK